MKTHELKAINFDNFGGFENFLTLSSYGVIGRASQLKAFVPWLAKANNLTKNAVASLPFEIRKGDEVVDSSADWKNKIGGMPNPKRTLSLLAGSLCGGSAYILPIKTSRMLVSLQYAAPQTMTPYITGEGLQWFDRLTDKGKADKLSPQEVIYFWLPDSDVEIGPPITSPMSTALPAAEILAANSGTMLTYAKRGWVPAYLGNFEGNITQPERERTEKWLNQFLKGAYNSVVKLINSTKFTLVKVGAGMEEMKGAYTEIQSQAIEDIGASFGIPAALFMSDKSYASEVKALVKEWYSSSEFVSIYNAIEETFNSQLLNQWGYTWLFKPESLDVFQEDENAKATAVSSYAGVINTDPEVAKFVMSFMGVDLDDSQTADLDALIAKKKPIPTEPKKEDILPVAKTETVLLESSIENTVDPLTPDEMKDLSLWYSKAKQWNGQGKGNAVDWECKHLREDIAEQIRASLKTAITELDIVHAFEVGAIPQMDDERIAVSIAAIKEALNFRAQ